MSSQNLFRDAIRGFIPSWLSERVGLGKTNAFRFMYGLVASLDALLEFMVQGQNAAHPGHGTPTALPYVGRSRGIIRGEDDTDDEYAGRLLTWIDRWKIAGSAEATARAIHEYLPGRPKVKVVSRNNFWVTIDTDGSIERHQNTGGEPAWDWDSASNPERAGYWSEFWVMVYPSPWTIRGGTLGDLTGDDGLGLGLLCTHVEADTIRGLIDQWKSAHSRCRAVIFTSVATLFDRTDAGTLPDGTWGQWGDGSTSGSRVAGGRNTSTCRYLEP